jgi:hypothetical protein
MWLLMKLLKHASLKFPKAGNLGPGRPMVGRLGL